MGCQQLLEFALKVITGDYKIKDKLPQQLVQTNP